MESKTMKLMHRLVAKSSRVDYSSYHHDKARSKHDQRILPKFLRTKGKGRFR